MPKLCTKDRCCGCTACAAVCAQDAISFVEGGDGFSYPAVDQGKCVECRRCEQVCLGLAEYPPLATRNVVAAQTNYDRILQTSSSGGVFSMLARKVLARGGVVYGAAFASDFKTVQHRRIDQLEDLALLQGSKYLQSNVVGVFRKVKGDLEAGKDVLFSGTPCQVAGLRAFLGCDSKSLLCVEVICHGVPSPLAWQAYLGQRKPVRKVEHRNKAQGWRRFSVVLSHSDGTCESSFFGDNTYMRGFLSELFNRKSCSCCVLRGRSSGADITLGDFWQVERFHAEYSADDRGCSAVIIQTEKGVGAWNQISPECRVVESSLKNVMVGNLALTKDPAVHPNRAKFFAQLPHRDFDILVKKLTSPSPWRRGSSLLGRVVRKIGLR